MALVIRACVLTNPYVDYIVEVQYHYIVTKQVILREVMNL